MPSILSSQRNSEEFHLDNCELSSFDFDYLKRVLKENPYVTSASFTEVTIKATVSLNILEDILSSLSGKTIFRLSICNMKQLGMRKGLHLARFAKQNMKLESLNLAESGFDDTDCLGITESLNSFSKSLKKLDLSGNLFEVGFPSVFNAILTCSNLQTLVLVKMNIHKSTLSLIFEQLQDLQVKHLDLSDNPIEKGLLYLSVLLSRNNIVSIKLNNCDLNQQLMEKFINISKAKNSSLTKLEAANNLFEDEGALVEKAKTDLPDVRFRIGARVQNK